MQTEVMYVVLDVTRQNLVLQKRELYLDMRFNAKFYVELENFIFRSVSLDEIVSYGYVASGEIRLPKMFVISMKFRIREVSADRVPC